MANERHVFYVIKLDNGAYFHSFGPSDHDSWSRSISSAIHYCSKENADMYLKYAPDGSKVMKVTETLKEEPA